MLDETEERRAQPGFDKADVRFYDARIYPRATKFIDDLYPMHIGAAGGTLHRILLCVAGLIPATLLISGFLMWRMRVRKRGTAGAPVIRNEL